MWRLSADASFGIHTVDEHLLFDDHISGRSSEESLDQDYPLTTNLPRQASTSSTSSSGTPMPLTFEPRAL